MKRILSVFIVLILILAAAPAALAEGLTYDRMLTIVKARYTVVNEYPDDKQVIVLLSGNGVSKDLDRAVYVSFAIEGTSDTILSIVSIPDGVYHKLDASAAILDACNQWNADKRWPTAYYSTEKGLIRGEYYVNLDGEFDDRLLEILISNVYAGMNSLYGYMGSKGIRQFSDFPTE